MRITHRIAFSLALVAAMTISAWSAVTINGAGATFPYPIYAKWAYKFNQITGKQVNYQSIGSGGGIQQIKAGTVDFGASDAALKIEELDASGLTQFPMIIGGVVPVIHVSGIEPGTLRLAPTTLAAIYMGTIANWNDPAIRGVNPDVKLPEKPIAVIHRADGSGTTWVFTQYLSVVSPEWKEKVGADKAVAWPVGLGGKGNEGVASYVQQIDGAIGYVEYAYALQNNMTHVQMKNYDGNFVQPTSATFAAAAAGADWKSAPGMYLVLVNQPGKDSWPITGASFIIVHKEQKNAETAKAVLSFFDWCYKNGAETALELDYVPIPESVADFVRDNWRIQIKSNGRPVWK